MPKNGMKIVAGVGAAGALAVSGAALASSQTPSPTPSQSSSSAQAAPQGGDMRGMGGMRGHEHKRVSAATATSVKNAVKAKDAAVIVKDVRQDEDGSYDAFGTKAGKRVMVEVSKDLKTITVRTGGMGHGGPGGHGEHKRGTEVTGTALTNVKSAVKAKDAAVTVDKAFKESDGTYHAMGTKAGKRVMVDVSKDLKTVTVKTGMPGGPGGHGGHGHGPRGGFDGQAPQGQPGQQGATQNQSGTTSGTSSSTGAAV